MVHPYLKRRKLPPESIEYASAGVKRVLGRTLGVPIFQEQVMALLQEVADFSADEADDLRRSMAAWKRRGGVEKFEPLIRERMAANDDSSENAEQIIQQIRGFGSYGFPESHAASFALLAYASSWLKHHHPAAFACALLNSQPMGFYAPSQIVQDVRRHGIAVHPVDVRFSDWDCTLEPDPRRGVDARAIRLGLRMVRGCSEKAALRLMDARRQQPFADIADLCARAGIDRRQQELLADAAALRGLVGHRHRARWAVAGVEPQLPLFGNASPAEQAVILPLPTQAEDTLADYARTGLSLGVHPLRQIRSRLNAARCIDGKALRRQPHNSRVRVAGLVTSRQQPQTASGIIFVTLEDEHGLINVVVWRQVAEAQRLPLLQARLLAVEGQWERMDGVTHLIAHRLKDLTPLLGALDARSRDFQ
jgi:error-prone DNA polymerase